MQLELSTIWEDKISQECYELLQNPFDPEWKGIIYYALKLLKTITISNKLFVFTKQREERLDIRNIENQTTTILSKYENPLFLQRKEFWLNLNEVHSEIQADFRVELNELIPSTLSLIKEVLKLREWDLALDDWNTMKAEQKMINEL